MSAKPPSSRRPPVLADRVRAINGGFTFIPHRFLHDGFFASLSNDERSLYFFLALAGDRDGISFYRYDSICSTLQCTLDDYLAARNGLIDKNLLAFDGTRFQVLSLPPRPVWPSSPPLTTNLQFEANDPATVSRIVRDDK
jgi:hypothetical protein